MKVPHSLNRKITMIDQKIKYKSSELKIFIFYWAVPLLMDILPNIYWNLLCIYVFAVRTLYEPIESIVDVSRAKELMETYFNNLDEFFGEYAYDYTIHAHLHLADQVIKHGPLHSHSQFVFEVICYNYLMVF
jgi:hypothetical protein